MKIVAILSLVLLGILQANAAVKLADMNSTIPVMVQVKEYSNDETKLQAMVDRAQLGNHGFTAEVVTKLITSPGGSPMHEKVYHFYKEVPCHRVPDVEEELEALFPGVFSAEAFKALNNKILAKPRAALRMCKVGLEMQHLARVAGKEHAHVKTRRAIRKACVCTSCYKCTTTCGDVYCITTCTSGTCCVCDY